MDLAIIIKGPEGPLSERKGAEGPLIFTTFSEKCNFWQHFVIGAPNGPPYRMTGKKCNFWQHFVIAAPNGPPYMMTGIMSLIVGTYSCAYTKKEA